MKKKFIQLMILISVFSLSSCASLRLPKTSDTNVEDVYKQVNVGDEIIKNSYETANLSNFMLDKNNQIKSLFKTLENPDIIIFVYPHISKGGLPIPAYTTQIKLFNIENYALPNEKISRKR